MEMLPEILARYSCKDFQDKPIDPESLRCLGEAARLSPSAKNRQAWRFVIMTKPELRARVAEACYGQEHVIKAPCLIACCTTNIDYKMPNGQLSYPVDIGLAAGFLMLQATHLGLGSCAISTFEEERVKNIITLPYQMKIVLLLAIGYPADTQPERQRLPLSRIISENRW